VEYIQHNVLVMYRLPKWNIFSTLVLVMYRLPKWNIF
jgi:hypothetical protein